LLARGAVKRNGLDCLVGNLALLFVMLVPETRKLYSDALFVERDLRHIGT